MAGSITASQTGPITYVADASASVDNTNVVAGSEANVYVINRHASNTIWVRTDGTDASAATGSIPVLPSSTSLPIPIPKGTTKVSVLGSAGAEPFAIVVLSKTYR